MIYELIYNSISAKDFDKKSLPDILLKSRSWNSANQITGCLVYHESEFLQILEGPEEVVKELYNRILLDHRHYNVQLLAQGPIKERAFADWCMAYYDFSVTNNSAKNKISVDLLLQITGKMNDATIARSLFKFITEDIFRSK